MNPVCCTVPCLIVPGIRRIGRWFQFVSFYGAAESSICETANEANEELNRKPSWPKYDIEGFMMFWVDISRKSIFRISLRTSTWVPCDFGVTATLKQFKNFLGFNILLTQQKLTFKPFLRIFQYVVRNFRPFKFQDIFSKQNLIAKKLYSNAASLWITCFDINHPFQQHYIDRWASKNHNHISVFNQKTKLIQRRKHKRVDTGNSIKIPLQLHLALFSDDPSSPSPTFSYLRTNYNNAEPFAKKKQQQNVLFLRRHTINTI